MHARLIRQRARRTTSVVAASAVAALLLSACGGEPEAQETVGPTAGAPSPTSEQSYEPTLPPYTSDVELSDEETAQVEETLQAIDELFHYASSLSPGSVAGLERMAAEDLIAAELHESHEKLSNQASSENQKLVGAMEVTETSVWEYTYDDYGYFGVCLNYDGWGLVDSTTGLTPDGKEPPDSRLQMATLKAHYKDGRPVLQDLLFGAPEDECNNL